MLLLLLIFLTVTFGLIGLFHLLPGCLPCEESRVTKRFAEEFGSATPMCETAALFKDLDALSLAPVDEYALLEQQAASSLPLSPGFAKSLEARLRRLKWSVTVEQFLWGSGLLAFCLGGMGIWLLGWGAGVLGILAGAGLPFLFLNWKQRIRKEQLLRQLPGAFELMARVIKSGQSVPHAFEAAADAFEEPLAEEFSDCVHQQNLGLRPEIVLQQMAITNGILELRIFVMALSIQMQTGGNLTDVLDRLAVLIRTRLGNRQQVRTLTAEGRLQGMTLLILPFLMFGAMSCVNRDYAFQLLNHSKLLWLTGLCMLVGVVWIRRIVTLDG